MPTAGPVVVAGEALADLVANASGGYDAHLGGGPFNAARTLSRLGQSTYFAGALSTDGLGTRMRERLVADGVRLDLVSLVEAPTTLALVDVGNEGGAEYRFYTQDTSAPLLEAVSLPSGIAALHVGTLGLVLEPMASTIEALVVGAPRDAFVMVDPNCRPDLIRDRAAFRARLDRILARADLVKASVEDLAYLEPDCRPAEAARRLGVPAVVTAGADGALAVTREDVVEVPAAPRAGGRHDRRRRRVRRRAARLVARAGAAAADGRGAGRGGRVRHPRRLVVVSRAGANPPWRAEL